MTAQTNQPSHSLSPSGGGQGRGTHGPLYSPYPKVELHVHLEGSANARTLVELARTGRTPNALPTLDPDVLREQLICRGFQAFLDVWDWLRDLWVDPENLAHMTRSYLERAAIQNVRYVEFRFNAAGPARRGLPLWEGLEAIAAARREAFQNWGIRSGLLIGHSRHRPEEGISTAMVAIQAVEKGLAHGIDLSGDETGYPVSYFRDAFRRAREYGLHITVHAGEWAGPESVWGAIRQLYAERIGHGVRSHQDPELIGYLRQEGITLEVCPTSNVCTGVYPSLAQHPIRQLYEAGVKVTVSSDDPPLFGTDIDREYGLLESVYDFTPEQVAEVTLNAVEAAFLPKEEKALLRGEVIEGYRALGVDIA
jgi:aminodeoxyfutalosine deaminase